MKINDAYAPGLYVANEGRYNDMKYRRCGRSGILLPALSMGLWHNLGHTDDLENGRNILRACFDYGITHFDLANNYGPPFGAAEENFGRIFRQDFKPYRDELIISTKEGWIIGPAPMVIFGLLNILRQILVRRLRRWGRGLVDIFNHNAPNQLKPPEPAMGPLI